MLSLGSVLFHRDEIFGLAECNGRLLLLLQWRATDVPVLFDLPARASLVFDHLEGDGAFLPVSVQGWSMWREGQQDFVGIYMQLEKSPCRSLYDYLR